MPLSLIHISGKGGKDAFAAVYRIEEGDQMRVGTVRIEGNEQTAAARLMPQLNTVPGQLLSPANLAGDRDALLTGYMNRGFNQARVEVAQQIEQADANKVDVVFHITEGQQVFVRKVLLSGLHYARPATIAHAITLHPGDPLNQAALMETPVSYTHLDVYKRQSMMTGSLTSARRMH